MKTIVKPQTNEYALREHIRIDLTPNILIGSVTTIASAIGVGALIYAESQTPGVSLNCHQILHSTSQLITDIMGTIRGGSVQIPTKQEGFTALFEMFTTSTALFTAYTFKNLMEFHTTNKEIKTLRRK